MALINMDCGIPGRLGLAMQKLQDDHFTKEDPILDRWLHHSELTYQTPSPNLIYEPQYSRYSPVDYSQSSLAYKQPRDRTSHTSDSPDDLLQFYQSYNNELNLKFQHMQTIPASLFNFSDISSLNLSHTGLTRLPPEIGSLCKLNRLDLSNNYLESLPAELGLLVHLKTLNLYGNRIVYLPTQMGSLGRLEKLYLDRNPIDSKQKEAYTKGGIPTLIRHLQHSAPKLEPPKPRQVLDLVDSARSNINNRLSVLSYNTLSAKSADPKRYSSVTADVLAWESRRKVILGEIEEQISDVVCLQEVDTQHYHDYWEPRLKTLGYKGSFQSKIQPGNGDADGCATFWRREKFILLEKRVINLTELAIHQPGLRDIYGNVFTRASKDNIAILTFLQDRLTGARTIVANTHLTANPTFTDVKIVQAAVLLKELYNVAEDYATRSPLNYPYYDDAVCDASLQAEIQLLARPLQYASYYDIPLVLAGDFNSLPNSAVYQLLSTGQLEPYHKDFAGYSYGELTSMGFSAPYYLTSAYEGTNEDANFTIYTPNFKGTVDYVWYNPVAMQATRVLGPADDEYTKKVPGFPCQHFPSDHIKLAAEFAYWG